MEKKKQIIIFEEEIDWEITFDGGVLDLGVFDFRGNAPKKEPKKRYTFIKTPQELEDYFQSYDSELVFEKGDINLIYNDILEECDYDEEREGYLISHEELFDIYTE